MSGRPTPDGPVPALARLAVVPANAGPQARAEADLIVPGNDEFGAAFVLEALARAVG